MPSYDLSESVDCATSLYVLKNFGLKCLLAAIGNYLSAHRGRARVSIFAALQYPEHHGLILASGSRDLFGALVSMHVPCLAFHEGFSTDALFPPVSATARSWMPSPLKFPTATHAGLAGVARVINEAAAKPPEREQHYSQNPAFWRLAALR
jgi:hypothetical protein